MVPDAESPIAEFVRAAQAHDVPGMVARATPDVVLSSPITTSFQFRGQRQVAEVMEDVYAVLPDASYSGDVGDDRARALHGTATIDGMQLSEIVLIELDEKGLVKSMELFMRPMPAVVALAAKLGPRVARRRGRARAAALTVMLTPMAVLMRHGERLASRLARPA